MHDIVCLLKYLKSKYVQQIWLPEEENTSCNIIIPLFTLHPSDDHAGGRNKVTLLSVCNMWYLYAHQLHSPLNYNMLHTPGDIFLQSMHNTPPPPQHYRVNNICLVFHMSVLLLQLKCKDFCIIISKLFWFWV